ncbi:MAG: hypothetical protein H6734_11980 [Alphaproteobacteria bacterium]|nr:hypothetical protein [Alphaproteobacteria bacterium]
MNGLVGTLVVGWVVVGAVVPLALLATLTFSVTRSYQQELAMASAPPADPVEIYDQTKSEGQDIGSIGLGSRGTGRGGGGTAAGIKIIRGTTVQELRVDAGGTFANRMEPDAEPEPEAVAKTPAARAPARVRQWFPEAFLWRPSLVTDADGLASVDVRVPDALTDWRVLALAHDRAGHPTGGLHTFASVLPVSVDPLTPGWLYAGDTLRLDTRASAMGAPFRGEVRVEMDGAVSGSAGGPVELQPGGSALVAGALRAERVGTGRIRAEVLDGARVDGAERTVDVRPTGRPVERQLGGNLTGLRKLDVRAAGATTETLSVRVFPGPLAVFRAEVDRVGQRPGPYGYALIAGVQALSAKAGVEVDHDALRTLRIRALQDLVRATRSPSGLEAARLLTGLPEPGEDDPLARTARDRLIRALEHTQRGDGTWTDRDRTSAQHVIVQTAASGRALPESSRGARIRASGALERLLPNVDDPYTAAWVLASGLVGPSLRPQLQERVVEGLEELDGRWRLRALPSDVRGVSGGPTHTERLAVAWLALADRDDLPLKGDLLAELLESWSATSGFAGGWADALALQALQEGLPSLDQAVTVVLERDGMEVGRGALDPAQPNQPLVLLADGGGSYTLRAQPEVPGLVFTSTHTAWMPFTGDEGVAGVDVEVSQGPLHAGRAGRLKLTVAAPSGARVTLHQGIPAGTVVEVPLRPEIVGSEVFQDHVELVTRPFAAGTILEIDLTVTPMYAGRMQTRPLHVEVGSQTADAAPHLWDVAP